MDQLLLSPTAGERVRTLLKRLPGASAINSAVRARLTELNYRRWCRRYSTPSVLDFRSRPLCWRGQFSVGGQVKTKPPVRREYRIFFIGTDWDQDSGGLVQGLEQYGEVCVLRANGKLGLELPRLRSTIEPLRQRNSSAVATAFREFASKGPVDVVVGQMWNFAVDVKVLREIRSTGSAVVNIGMDDRHSFHLPRLRDGSDGGVAGILPALSLAATAAPECVQWYRRFGVPAFFCPEASDPSIFGLNLITKKYDVTFIGANYGFRQVVVNKLRAAGINVLSRGAGWPGGRVATEEVPKLFAESKIVLGIGGILHCRDFTALKLRDFDAVMSGSLYLAQHNPDLEIVYDIGRELDTWRTIPDLINKCQLYLADTKKRESIGIAGRQAAALKHTWSVRFGELFATLHAELGGLAK